MMLKKMEKTINSIIFFMIIVLQTFMLVLKYTTTPNMPWLVVFFPFLVMFTILLMGGLMVLIAYVNLNKRKRANLFKQIKKP